MTFYCKRGGSAPRVERVVIPFELDGKTFVNGKCYLEHEEYIGVMVNGIAVFIGRDKMKSVPEITETELIVDLPFWFIESKSLELFVDTSDNPSLF